jgi:DNA-directed RNA polymerase specialized sigma24 family protein
VSVDENHLRELMIRYQAREASALKELVSHLSPRLLRFLSHQQLARADAEDFLQDCWLRIHRALHTYRAPEPLLPWVFAIADHTRLDGFRRRQRRGRLEVLVPVVPEGRPEAPQVSTNLTCSGCWINYRRASAKLCACSRSQI